MSLWLNCMHPGLTGTELRCSSPSGQQSHRARRATYAAEQVKARAVEVIFGQAGRGSDGPAPPRSALWSGVRYPSLSFPGEGWGAAAEIADLKGKGGKNPIPALAGEWSEVVRAWRSSVQGAPTNAQIERLSALSRRVESAWASAAASSVRHLRRHDALLACGRADESEWSTSGATGSTPFLDREGRGAPQASHGRLVRTVDVVACKRDAVAYPERMARCS